MADGFLAGGGDVDRFEREGDFDEFFLGVGQGYDIQFWILLANSISEVANRVRIGAMTGR